MRLRILLTSLALLLAAISLTALSPAKAAVYSDPSYVGQPVVGLVIRYVPGVDPVDAFGNQRAISNSTLKLSKGLDVGLGMYSAKFDEAVDETSATKAANQVATESSVLAVYLDHFLGAEIFSTNWSNCFGFMA
ncbi:MAG: hypothetical protein EBT65_01805 [Actinobacteria bacterium]|nr:hypothetical protein [Actinomycetota bacterium]